MIGLYIDKTQLENDGAYYTFSLTRVVSLDEKEKIIRSMCNIFLLDEKEKVIWSMCNISLIFKVKLYINVVDFKHEI